MRQSSPKHIPALATGPRQPPQAGSSYHHPFELLAACHERVDASLALLQRLCAHLPDKGLDTGGRDAALDVLRYFDIAAPLHHQDEELHVFPVLEASDDPVLQDACRNLRAQHQAINAHWEGLRGQLQALATTPDGAMPAEALAALQRGADYFVHQHAEHLDFENQHVFPAAQDRLSGPALQAMGLEMADRRGLKLG